MGFLNEYPQKSTPRVDSRSCKFVNGHLSLPVSLHHVSIYYYPSVLTPIVPCFLLTTFDFYATLPISSINMIQFLKFFCFNILPYGNNNNKKKLSKWMMKYGWSVLSFTTMIFYCTFLFFHSVDGIFCYWPSYQYLYHNDHKKVCWIFIAVNKRKKCLKWIIWIYFKKKSKNKISWDERMFGCNGTQWICEATCSVNTMRSLVVRFVGSYFQEEDNLSLPSGEKYRTTNLSICEYQSRCVSR